MDLKRGSGASKRVFSFQFLGAAVLEEIVEISNFLQSEYSSVRNWLGPSVWNLRFH